MKCSLLSFSRGVYPSLYRTQRWLILIEVANTREDCINLVIQWQECQHHPFTRRREPRSNPGTLEYIRVISMALFLSISWSCGAWRAACSRKSERGRGTSVSFVATAGNGASPCRPRNGLAFRHSNPERAESTYPFAYHGCYRVHRATRLRPSILRYCTTVSRSHAQNPGLHQAS